MTVLTVLFVDDDPDIRIIAEMSLGLDPGFRVRLAGSGAEALQSVRNEVPDLILLDMMMPEMDGCDTFAALKDLLDPMPLVIFVTARTRSEDVARLTDLGAVGVIPKPFDPIKLAPLVRSIMG